MTNSIAERFFDYDLWLVGAAHFVILIASFQVPYRLNWKDGPAAADAIQSQTALGTRVDSPGLDHHRVRHTDFGAARRTAPR